MDSLLGVMVRVPAEALDPSNTGVVGVILSILVMLTFARIGWAILKAIFNR